MVNSMRSKKRILALATVIAVVSVVLSSCSKTVFDAQKYITQTENLTFSKYQDKTFTEVTPTAEFAVRLSAGQAEPFFNTVFLSGKRSGCSV